MRVLHIITAINHGGAETMLCKYLESSASSEDQHAVFSLMTPGPKAERIRALGVPIYTLNMARGLPGPVDTIRLARIVNLISPDLLHGWMYHGNLAASFAHKTVARHLPLVWNIRHSLADPKAETKRTQAILKLSARISNSPSAIIYNSANALREHEKVGYSPKASLVIPNGFDFDMFQPNPRARERLNAELGIDPNAILVGKVARHHPMKDHAMLIEAVAEARGQGHDIHLLMVGEGLEPPPADLAQMAAQLLPADRMTFTGGRADVAEWLSGLDVLAVASAWGEGFPNVIGEAMACEVPVVTTDVGDSRLIVGDHGIVVPPGAKSEFAAGLAEMCAMGPEGRQAMGRAARYLAKSKYSVEEIASRYDKLHRGLYCNEDVSRMMSGEQNDPVGAPTR